MKLHWIFDVIVVFTIIFVCYEVKAQSSNETEDSISPRGFRFHASASRQTRCQVRQQEGICKRRSQCRKRTRKVCQFGLNPIICCLDEIPTTTVSSSKPTVVTKRPIRSKPLEQIDLTFPDCGLRTPKLPNANKAADKPKSTRRRSSFLSRLGKREISEEIMNFSEDLIRDKRAIQPVIVGGEEVDKNSWPWMVIIFEKTSIGNQTSFLCGASLISRRYVLTAAHCFDESRNPNPSKYVVVVGAHSATNDGKEYEVKKITLHPDYQQQFYYNDICLLETAQEIVLGPKIYPVCLPSNGLRGEINLENNMVTVTGWGDTSFGGLKSKVLREVSIPIVPLKECNTSYVNVASKTFPYGITDFFICAGMMKEGGKDACQGDSGGPLVNKLKGDKWVQIGVVSFGYGCADPGYPGVYTRTSKFIQWLYDNTDLGKDKLN